MTHADRPDAPWRPTDRGLVVRVRLTPKARRNVLDAAVVETARGPALRAWVTAPPVDGAANTALIGLAAKTWRVAKSTITITQGARDRDKELTIAGAPDEVAARLGEWLNG